MTRDDVIRMARECGLLDARDDTLRDDGIAQFVGTLSDFAALVAQQEREACAKVCDQLSMALDHRGNEYVRSRECQQAANAIRTRTNSTVKQSLTVAEAVAAELEASGAKWLPVAGVATWPDRIRKGACLPLVRSLLIRFRSSCMCYNPTTINQGVSTMPAKNKDGAQGREGKSKDNGKKK